MSGGYFDYKQYAMIEIAETIRSNIAYGTVFGDKTVEIMKEAYRQIRIAHIYAHRMDWMMSGDDSEESMQQRLDEDLSAFEEEFETKDWTE